MTSHSRHPHTRALALAGVLVILLAGSGSAFAQVVNPTPSQRQYRAYIPQDQVV
jgi:hypothetical protein